MAYEVTQHDDYDDHTEPPRDMGLLIFIAIFVLVALGMLWLRY